MYVCVSLIVGFTSRRPMPIASRVKAAKLGMALL